MKDPLSRVYSDTYCQGFCTLCGTACGEYNEQIHDLREELSQQQAFDFVTDKKRADHDSTP